jgi:hypothetical protein
MAPLGILLLAVAALFATLASGHHKRCQTQRQIWDIRYHSDRRRFYIVIACLVSAVAMLCLGAAR